MNASQINPFLDATAQVWKTMLGCVPKMGKAGTVKEETSEDIIRTAIIGLSGTVRGAVALTFPSATAEKVVIKLVQAKPPLKDDEINDALGEVANMIAGSAKAKLEGQTVSISLPTVVRGQKYALIHPKDSVTIAVPFESDLGKFSLNVTFSTSEKLRV
jgi:chemotaxis protein CheX